MKNTATQLGSAFGGTLIRQEDGWFWSDGTREPNVFDRTWNDHFNFSMAAKDAVAVPQFKVQECQELAWVRDGGYGLAENRDGSVGMEFLRRFPERQSEPILSYLVPLSDWEKHTAAIIGVSYSMKDMPKLAEKARSQGYSGPFPAASAKAPAKTKLKVPEPFTKNELLLVADVLNGINTLLVMDAYAWPSYTRSGGDLACDVGEAIGADRLDLKWGVDGASLCNKLKALHPVNCRRLMLGMAEFWNRRDKKARAVFDRLVQELNGD